MNETCIQCLSREELRAMIKEVADQAAKTAAKEVALELKLEISELKGELKREFSKELDAKLSVFMGMTPNEHAIEHDRMRRMMNTFNQINDGISKKLIAGIVAIILIVGAGYNAQDIKAIVNPKPVEVKERRDDAK